MHIVWMGFERAGEELDGIARAAERHLNASQVYRGLRARWILHVCSARGRELRLEPRPRLLRQRRSVERRLEQRHGLGLLHQERGSDEYQQHAHRIARCRDLQEPQACTTASAVIA